MRQTPLKKYAPIIPYFKARPCCSLGKSRTIVASTAALSTESNTSKSIIIIIAVNDSAGWVVIQSQASGNLPKKSAKYFAICSIIMRVREIFALQLLWCLLGHGRE